MTRPRAVLLFPGAGSDRDHSALVAVERAVAPIVCVRADFPYRVAGRRAPDRAPVLIESVKAHAADLAARHRVRPPSIVLGGRSMGGRMCSMAVAEGLPTAGLALISYPLHPPGRPESLRVEHLGRLEAPCLFVHGTRDPFGSPDELLAATAAIPGPVTHEWIDGGRHDLKGSDELVAAMVARWVHGLRG